MSDAPICRAKAESASLAENLRAEVFLPPRELEREQGDLIRVAEPAPAPLKLPAILARDQMAAWAREKEKPAQTRVADLAT
jgi:hypothetical protein